MSYMKIIRREFTAALTDFQQCNAMTLLANGQLGITHYAWILRQIFHHARENPQIQALATVHFRGTQRAVVRRFYQHAVSEIGHDQLALNDLAAIGVDTSGIPLENPLPATTALLAYPFYEIRERNPIGYLGYLFFLEFTPTSSGAAYMAALRNAGVPDNAMTFLQDHATVDVAHNKLMEEYVDILVTSERDCQTVIYALQVTGQLYGAMLDGAVRQADQLRDYGLNENEVLHTSVASTSNRFSSRAADY